MKLLLLELISFQCFFFAVGFQCEGIVEEHEDDLLELFASENSHVEVELCTKRARICPALRVPEEL